MSQKQGFNCFRCGVCCICSPEYCDVNNISNKTGRCLNLIIRKEGNTSCKFIKKHGNIFSDGCVFSFDRKAYERYKEIAEKIVKIKLVDIKEERNVYQPSNINRRP